MAKRPRKVPVKPELLTADVRAELDKQAQASVVEEMTQAARDAYFAEKMEELRREHVPADQMTHVLIDVAPYVNCIMIEGVQYFHGYTYEVPQRCAAVLYEQMWRSWSHQDEIDGRGRSEAYRRPQNRVLGPAHVGQATRGVNGPVVAEI